MLWSMQMICGFDWGQEHAISLGTITPMAFMCPFSPKHASFVLPKSHIRSPQQQFNVWELFATWGRLVLYKSSCIGGLLCRTGTLLSSMAWITRKVAVHLLSFLAIPGTLNQRICYLPLGVISALLTSVWLRWERWAQFCLPTLRDLSRVQRYV